MRKRNNAWKADLQEAEEKMRKNNNAWKADLQEEARKIQLRIQEDHCCEYKLKP